MVSRLATPVAATPPAMSHNNTRNRAAISAVSCAWMRGSGEAIGACYSSAIRAAIAKQISSVCALCSTSEGYGRISLTPHQRCAMHPRRRGNVQARADRRRRRPRVRARRPVGAHLPSPLPTAASACGGTRRRVTTSAWSRTAWSTDRGLVGLGNAGEPYDNFGQGRHYEEPEPGRLRPARSVKVLDARASTSRHVPRPGPQARRDPRSRSSRCASCRVYNDWMAEWCAAEPARLVGVGALPMQDPAPRPPRRTASTTSASSAASRGPNAYNDRHSTTSVHAGVGGARGDRPPARVAPRRALPTCRARRSRWAPHGAGHAPRADPPLRRAR